MWANLYIPKPCCEDWNKMTPAEQGKHCTVCNKVVKDLTGLNKLQTLQLVANTKNEHVCGRVNSEILDAYPTFYSKLVKAFRRFQIQIITLLGLFILDKKVVSGQNLSIDKNQNKSENKNFSNKKMNLRIKVETQSGEPVSFANIIITGKNSSQKASICDTNGNANISFIETEMAGNEISMTVSCLGFETKTIEKIYLLKASSQILITLTEAIIDLPEYSVIRNNISFERMGCIGVTRSRSCGDDLFPLAENETDSIGNDEKSYQDTPLRFNAYPDPTEGIFTIECNKSIFFDLQIFDNSGKMLSAIFQVAARKEIDLAGNGAGIYYVNIMENGSLLDTKKIILVK